MSLTKNLERDVTDPGVLRAALARSDLYGYELAARLKRDPSTISQWLNGHKPIPVEIGEQILRQCTRATRKPLVPTPANGLRSSARV